MSDLEQVTKEPLTGNISAVVPMAVKEAIVAEARAKDRSVSYVAARIFIDWYRRQPGAQVEMKLVVPDDGGAS